MHLKCFAVINLSQFEICVRRLFQMHFLYYVFTVDELFQISV